LDPGQYQFEVLIEPLGGDFEIPFDAVKDPGLSALAAGLLAVGRDRHPRIELRIEERVSRFEFRLFCSPAYDLKPFRFLGLSYVRPSIVRGAHQAEAMALLARFVELRLRNAYATELT